MTEPTPKRLTSRAASTIAHTTSPSGFVHGKNACVTVAPALTIPIAVPSGINVPVEAIPIQRPIGMPVLAGGFPAAIAVPPMTLSRLSDVTCLPGGVMLAAPNIVLEETFSAPWEREHHHHLIKLTTGDYALKALHASASPLPGRYICLDYQHYPHYGHFLVDVLSRIWAYDYLTNVFGIDDLHVLVADVEAAFPMQLLELYGVPGDRIVRLRGPALVEELFVPTKSFQIQEFTSPIASGIWKKISLAARGAGGPERIYISRTLNPQRRLVNELEVEEAMAQRGFHVLHPETVPARQQVAMFANATLIVGTSGSNVFNLAFQSRLKAALILVSPALVHFTDVFLQYGSRSDLAYFVGEAAHDYPGFNPLDVHAPWRVDVDQFIALADRWISAYP